MEKHQIHYWYNKTSFPNFVVNHGNWDIYADENGYCAAIPAEHAPIGCKASHYGDMNYVRGTLWRELEAQKLASVES